MKFNLDRCRILYLEKEKFLYSTLLAFLLYLFIWTLFYDSPSLRIIVLAIIYLIAACTIVMLCRPIFSTKNKVYYQFISCMYMCIAVASMLKVIPIQIMNNKFILTLRNEVFLSTTYIQILSVQFYYVLNYIYKYKDINGKTKNKKMIILYIISNILFFINYICTLLMNEGALILINIGTLASLLFIVNKYKSMRIVKANKVNFIISWSCLGIVVVILNLIIVVLPDLKEYIVYVKEVVLFEINVSLIISIIDGLINRPYKMLFDDLYRENLEMDILNEKVMKKNRELEISQSIIRKREKMFKIFFSNVPIPMVIVSETGRIIFANLSFQKLVEESNIKNIINKKIMNIIKINNLDSIEHLVSNYNDEDISGVISLENVTKYVDIDIVKLIGEDHETLFILNDVTTRVNIGKIKTDIENNRFQERIKSDFLSNISHDLKTPINVIYSASQLVAMFIKNNDKESLLKYNMICKLNCFSLIRLTNNLIDSSRIYSDYLSPNMKVKNIVEIIEEVVMSLIDYAKSKNINLVFDTDEEEIYAKIDDEFMQRIIINLISNSIKFTNQNGKIEVIIHNEDKEVVVNVKDNGVGMESEFIENAFNRYSMGKNNSECKDKGTGIGLFVVKKLIEKQGGKIDIISGKNKGTNVEMKFNKEI